MRSRVAILLVAATLACASSGVAEHSASPCESDVVTIDAGATAFYLVLDEDLEAWLYVETNGHADLQRGGARWYEVGTGPIRPSCWDVDLATGERIPDPDLIAL